MSSADAVEIPLIKATNESLKGYGYLIDSYESSKVEIVTWPKQGWREIDKGTGNEGGSTEGSFDTWWEGVLCGDKITLFNITIVITKWMVNMCSVMHYPQVINQY